MWVLIFFVCVVDKSILILFGLVLLMVSFLKFMFILLSGYGIKLFVLMVICDFNLVLVNDIFMKIIFVIIVCLDIVMVVFWIVLGNFCFNLVIMLLIVLMFWIECLDIVFFGIGLIVNVLSCKFVFVFCNNIVLM